MVYVYRCCSGVGRAAAAAGGRDARPLSHFEI